MAKAILRFYGRFLCAVEMDGGGTTGVISFIAPKFGDGLRPHTTYLSIATMDVHVLATNVAPTFMLAAPQNPEGGRAETAVWDLADKTVGLPDDGSRSATLGVSQYSPQFPLLDLNDLVGRVEAPPAVLNTDVLEVGEHTQSVIRITRGDGIVHRVLRPEFTNNLDTRKIGDTGHLVTVEDTRDADPDNDEHFGTLNDDGTIGEIGVGEVVEFEFDIPTLDPFTLEVQPGSAPSGEPDRISMRAIDETQVVMASFSNLCAHLPTNEHYDLEFEQYYGALTPGTQPGDLALVPKPSDDGGEPASCQALASIRYDKTTGEAV